MGGGGKGGSADPSGMYQAMASVQAANQAYQFGEQELQWGQQQFALEWPYMSQAAQQELSSQQQSYDFAQNQQQFYEQQYQPMEAAYNTQVMNWGSADNIAMQTGMAEANVNEAVNAQKQSSIEQLEGYGVNPGATRFSGLMNAIGVQGGAAAAGAGTNAAMQTRLQAMGLESGAINTGRGFPSAVAGLAGAGTQAGGTSTSGLQGALTSGANAMTAGSSLYSAGAQNMGVYVNAVNGYNQTQLGYAQLGAQEMAGLFGGIGSLAGGVMGMLPFGAAKGGPIEKFDAGGTVDPIAESTPPPASNYNIGADSFSKGFSGAMQADRQRQENKTFKSWSAIMDRPIGASGSGGAYQHGGTVGAIPRRGEASTNPWSSGGHYERPAMRYQGGGTANQAPAGLTPSQAFTLSQFAPGNMMPSGSGMGPVNDQAALDMYSRLMPYPSNPTAAGPNATMATLNPMTASAGSVLNAFSGGANPFPTSGGGGYPMYGGAPMYGGGYPPGMTFSGSNPSYMYGGASIPNSVANPALSTSRAPFPITGDIGTPVLGPGVNSVTQWQRPGGGWVSGPTGFTPPPSAYGYDEGGEVGMPTGYAMGAQVMQGPPVPPRGGTPGGFVPPQMSPSQGQADDDVDARLTAGEFVMPKDVVNWEGQKKFVGMIDNARKQKAILDARGDIGGEPAGPGVMPSRNPAFVSRPTAMPARAMA